MKALVFTLAVLCATAAVYDAAIKGPVVVSFLFMVSVWGLVAALIEIERQDAPMATKK